MVHPSVEPHLAIFADQLSHFTPVTPICIIRQCISPALIRPTAERMMPDNPVKGYCGGSFDLASSHSSGCLLNMCCS